jgi:hypothetical protein
MRYGWFVFFFSVWLGTPVAWAQGVRGRVRTTAGEPLSYAAVRVRNASAGTVTNAEGQYELPLKSGTYELVIQHLGYGAVTRSVTISDAFVTLDVTLSEQSVQLREVKVRASAEDPAYSMMRKAIATAPLHQREVARYTARVYVKGGGKLIEAKGLLSKPSMRDSLKIDSKRPGFFIESVSELTFEQPSTYRNRVIAVQSDLNGQAPPFPYLENSFYNPRLDELLSPLAPAAFGSYRFAYEGSFQDQGVDVNRIRVTPRSPGDDVVAGTLFLIEGTWSLHSLDFRYTRRGTPFRIRQQFAPVENVWVPISHELQATLKLLGLTFDVRYLASVSAYQLTVDPAVHARIGGPLLDEKVDSVPVDSGTVSRKRPPADSLLRKLETGESLTLKELRQVTRQLVQEQRRAAPDRQALRRDSVAVDSGAYRRDSTYWAAVRPIPLTGNETRSLAEYLRTRDERRDKARRDSLQLRRLLTFNALFAGGLVPLSATTRLELGSLLLARQFNVAEGFVLSPRVRWVRGGETPGVATSDETRLAFGAYPRYAFGRRQFSGQATAYYRRGATSLSAAGGRFINQFNPENPAPFFFNTQGRSGANGNFLKIYERDFISLTAARQGGESWVASVGVEAAYRRYLPALAAFDSTAEGVPTTNDPLNDELRRTAFPNHTALIVSASLRYRPFVKYEIRNGRKYSIQNATPELGLRVRRGVPGVLGSGGASSGADFIQLEITLGQYVRAGHRGKLEYLLRAGTFPNTRRLYFPDYQHFTSNGLRLLVHHQPSDFRLLDLYRFSTAGAYLTAHGQYEFRKLLLTRLPFVRRTGLREGVLGHYLYQQRLDRTYAEAGYALDGLFRFLRIEIVSAFLDGRYQRTDFRFGLALNLNGRFAKPFRELDEQIRQ